jgi:hypothetical protein
MFSKFNGEGEVILYASPPLTARRSVRFTGANKATTEVSSSGTLA